MNIRVRGLGFVFVSRIIFHKTRLQYTPRYLYPNSEAQVYVLVPIKFNIEAQPLPALLGRPEGPHVSRPPGKMVVTGKEAWKLYQRQKKQGNGQAPKGTHVTPVYSNVLKATQHLAFPSPCPSARLHHSSADFFS